MSYVVTELILPSQVEDILELSPIHHAEGYPYLDYSDEKLRFVFNRIMEDQERDLYNMFLAYKEDELIGYAYCHISQYVFSTQRSSTLEMLYVKKAARGSRVFLKLLKAYEEWARLRGCVEFFVGVSLDDMTLADKTSRLYEKVGYGRFGYIHKKRA